MFKHWKRAQLSHKVLRTLYHFYTNVEISLICSHLLKYCFFDKLHEETQYDHPG